MLPPPFPFKVFVLAASVFEMSFWHFLLAIFVGRLVRFLILSLLVLKFGPQVVALTSAAVARYWPALALAVTAIAGLLAWLWYRARRASSNH
jgi:uncharacterized membrane protein YdjX (TVP38/TMEM64 family)